MQETNRKFTYLMMLAMLFWGLSWPFSKIIAGDSPHRVILFWRFLITIISFVPVLLYLKVRLTFNWRAIGWILAGSFFYTAYNELFFLGLELGNPGAGGVLVTTLNPVITAILFSLFVRKFPGMRTMQGIILGITGAALLLKVWSLSSEFLWISGNFYFIIAAVSWSMVSLITKASARFMPVLGFTYFTYLLSFLWEWILVQKENPWLALRLGGEFWSVVAYLALISTAFSTTIFFVGSSKLGPVRAGAFLFLVPVTALLGSFLLFGENLNWNNLLGAVIAVRAVYLINTEQRAGKDLTVADGKDNPAVKNIE